MKKEKIMNDNIQKLIQAIGQTTILELETTKLDAEDIRTLISIYYTLIED